jgi:hypothetical protein
VISIGPQLGFIFPLGGMQGYLNFKGYKEFDAADRASGWNAWVHVCTFADGSCSADHAEKADVYKIATGGRAGTPGTYKSLIFFDGEAVTVAVPGHAARSFRDRTGS